MPPLRRDRLPDWVLFDVEGTLLDGRDPLRWAESAAAAGLPSDPEAIAHFVEELEAAGDREEPPPGAEEFWRRVFGRIAAAPVDPARIPPFLARLASPPPPARAFSDVAHGLRELRRQRIRLAILATDEAGAVAARLHRAGLSDRFEFVEAAGAAPAADPGRFARAVARAGSPPERLVYVGAFPHRGVRAARAAGIPALWLNRRGTGLGGELPEIVSLRELPEALRAGVRLK